MIESVKLRGGIFCPSSLESGGYNIIMCTSALNNDVCVSTCIDRFTIFCMLWCQSNTQILGTSQAPARCATTTTLSGPFADIIIELGEVNCFTCSQVISWTANNDMGNPISVTSASPLEIGGVTVVEVEGNYLVLPSPGQYVPPGTSGRRNIICTDTMADTYEARLSNPSKCMVACAHNYNVISTMSSLAALVAPTFNPVTVNEFTRLVIRCDNAVPNNVGRIQIFNPDGEMVGSLYYTVANVTREFAGTYSCVATSRIDPNITATTTTEIIVRCKVYNIMVSSIIHTCIKCS